VAGKPWSWLRLLTGNPYGEKHSGKNSWRKTFRPAGYGGSIPPGNTEFPAIPSKINHKNNILNFKNELDPPSRGFRAGAAAHKKRSRLKNYAFLYIPYIRPSPAPGFTVSHAGRGLP
jgi:hypothetical protein